MLLPALPPSASKFAKYIISLVDEDAGDSISNLKLQKLLYYSQGFHLAMVDKPLFHEAIKKWVHGPVVPAVWHEYKDYGSGPITIMPVELESYSEDVRELLDEVFSVYGQFTATKLRNMTHQEPPWNEAPDNGEISHNSMKRFFKTLVIEDEERQE